MNRAQGVGVGRSSGAILLIAAGFSCGACNEKPAASTAVDVSEAAAAEAEPAVSGSEGDPDTLEVAAMSDTESGGVGLLAEAEHILSTMTATSYAHRTRIEGGVYDVDCSGFVDYLLGRVSAGALAELRAATVRRPLAKHFVQFFQALPPSQHWQRVARVSDLEPGDLIAWLKPADVKSTNTGHVMVVAARPEPRDDGSFAVPILDSSASPHGKHDVRKGTHTTGIGRGSIALETDASGAAIAYHWTDWQRSPRHDTAIMLGRLR